MEGAEPRALVLGLPAAAALVGEISAPAGSPATLGATAASDRRRSGWWPGADSRPILRARRNLGSRRNAENCCPRGRGATGDRAGTDWRSEQLDRNRVDFSRTH